MPAVATPTTSLSILKEGHNYWKKARAERCSFLVDAAAYFEAFARAAEKAEQTLYICAWDIDGRVRLRRDRPTETLREFLLHLLEEKPRLHIYILTWRFVFIYGADRELFPSNDQVWHQHPRLHFAWDGELPFGSCHHQKIVTIDDRLAFSGGLDFTDERWDTPDHRPVDPRKHPLNRDHYKPFHDMMIMMEGDIALRLSDIFRARWQRAGPATPVQIPLKPHAQKIYWPLSEPIELTAVDAAISRTEPGFKTYPAVSEVEQLFEDTIAQAKNFLYIENQYFTASRIEAALGRQLQKKSGPEIILVLPQGTSGWIEEVSLGVLRWRAIRRLRALDRFKRFHVYYPYIQNLVGTDYIKVHSKLMIADDRFVRVGSANLCNRSMTTDTECDISIETVRGSEISRGIQQVRYRLLGEHLGLTPAQVAAEEKVCGSMAELIERHSEPDRRLVPFDGEVSPFYEWLIPHCITMDWRRSTKLFPLLPWLNAR